MKALSPNKIDIPVTLFLTMNLVLSCLLTSIYLWFAGWNWSIWILFFVLSFLTNLSITAGYHRLYAHRSYEAANWVKFLYLLFATSAWQGSAIRWASGHRIHHQEVDGDEDPYSIRKGFWYAHMKWMCLQMDQPAAPADLQKEPWLKFQDRYYIVLAIAAGYLLPAVLGYCIGDFWGGLIVLGGFRIAATQQSTYFVNSLAHYWGKQTYTEENSARDNFIVAVLTHGEGYHNFHHKFQIDYRNGVRWYHWDPTKWLIATLSWIGATWKLRRVSAVEMLKARLHMESQRLSRHGHAAEHLEQLKARILHAQVQIKKLKEEYAELTRQKKQQIEEFRHKFEAQRSELKQKIEVHKREFDSALSHWRAMFKLIRGGPQGA